MHTNSLRRLRNAARKKSPKKWTTNSWFLFLDNAPAHRLDLVKDLLAKNNVRTLEHPHYAPDVAAVDIYLLP